VRILIVEDDAALGSSTARGLELEGFTVDWRQDGPGAEAAMVSQRFDAIVLDLGLPGTSGEELLRGWRQAGNVTPVLVLTARGFVLDRVRVLNLGADDYLVKPFAMKELEARIRALYRRGRLQHGEVLRIADLTLDPVNLQVERGGQPLTLTRAGFALLELLLRRSPHLVRHADLAHALWGEAGGDIATLHTHLSVLRSVIDRPFKQQLLHTVHGFGYRMAESADA
jgi:DNA-binding response OmpR family regulator